MHVEQQINIMQNMEFAEFGSGMSSVLRLTAPWAGTPRVVVGDSAFASVKTAKALLDIMQGPGLC